ncbi:hypothetical protein [Luteolibacter sp. Populi]|uniref:hypothetical protein n=1 Tax=Luteolibacter sp. Populi TaxID=3230487 RepID=UPI003466CDD4
MKASVKRPRFSEINFDGQEPVKVVVLPDWGNPKSRQWRGKGVVLTRSNLAMLYRRWRGKGGKPRGGMVLASMLLDLLMKRAPAIIEEGKTEA